MILERFSHSGIQSFKKCPAQFKYRYINQIYKKDEGIEAFLGKLVHGSIEYLYNQAMVNNFISFDKLLNFYKSQWQEKWHNRVHIVYEKVLPIDQDRVDIDLWKKSINFYYLLGRKCLSGYYTHNQPIKQNASNVYANEHEMVFHLDQDESYKIKGIVDRLDHDGTGNWEIHDYKTGKRAMSQNDADKDHQLALYQIGLMAEVKEFKSIKLIWHFIQQGIRVESIRTMASLRKVIDETKKTIDIIRDTLNKNGEFHPKKSMLCNWCYYWEECPAQSGTNPYIKA